MSYKIMQTVQLHVCFLSVEKRGWKICMTAHLPEQDWASGDWYITHRCMKTLHWCTGA